jgi:hypothetical protein
MMHGAFGIFNVTWTWREACEIQDCYNSSRSTALQSLGQVSIVAPRERHASAIVVEWRFREPSKSALVKVGSISGAPLSCSDCN